MRTERAAIRWFAVEMEKQLKANDWKETWEDCSVEYLLGRAEANLNLIHTVMIDNNSPSLKIFAIKCCADVANFCMMLADNIRSAKKV